MRNTSNLTPGTYKKVDKLPYDVRVQLWSQITSS